jgi:hypothetical protein
MMNSESISLLIILQTYLKKIDTTGFQILIILFVIIIWFLITGGQKKKINKKVSKVGFQKINSKEDISKVDLNNNKSVSNNKSIYVSPNRKGIVTISKVVLPNNGKYNNSFQHRMILSNLDDLYESINYSYNYNDISKEEYDYLLSLKDKLIRNINYLELIKPKVIKLYEKFVTPEDVRMIGSFDKLNIDEIFGNNEFLSPFQDKVQIEYEKSNFKLFGKKLNYFTTNQYQVLINDEGFIYVDSVYDVYHNDMVYNGELIFPIDYLDYLDYDLTNSKFDFSLNINYFREVLKRVDDKEIFLTYLNKLILFNNNKSKKKKDPIKFFYNTTKENYKLKISELVKILYDTNSLSLNEYLINVELGRFNFDIEYVLNIIFKTRYIGSFFNKKRSELKITKTSLKLLSIDELVVFYRNNYSSKESFYKRFGVNNYINNLRIDSLNNEENYKKSFDYWEFNRVIDKENNFGLPESSIPYFGGWLPDKKIFLQNNLFINDVSDNLVDLIESELRKVENEIRILKGFKIVGSYTNESVLYVKLKEHFIDCKVISQGRPVWLGRQSLDIYFPDYNIGIEYQGEQHFRPIDFFGGIEKFNQVKILDEKKRELCKQNYCSLIEVKEDYDLVELIVNIENIIDTK